MRGNKKSDESITPIHYNVRYEIDDYIIIIIHFLLIMLFSVLKFSLNVLTDDTFDNTF